MEEGAALFKKRKRKMEGICARLTIVNIRSIFQ